MKTKLLKRLRKNANEYYRVLESKHLREKIYIVQYYSKSFGWDDLIGCYSSKEEAIERCEHEMRTYIIERVRKLRVRKNMKSPLSVVYGGNVSFWTKLLRMF